jgi:hypothetical protein
MVTALTDRNSEPRVLAGRFEAEGVPEVFWFVKIGAPFTKFVEI